MTRQWLSHPATMCRRHLLGEHLEAHIFVSKMAKGWKLDGFIRGSMFFGAEFVKQRHDQLAHYIGGHSTPLSIDGLDQQKYPRLEVTSEDMVKSVSDLVGRCEECKQRHIILLGGD